MTTSDPRARHRDDDRDDQPREQRGLGQRILDAVLGEPGDQRHDDRTDVRADDRTDDRATPAGPDRTTGDRVTGAPAGHPGDAPRSEHTSYEQAMRDAPPATTVPDDRGSAQGHLRQDTPVDRTEARRDAGYDPTEAAHDARRDVGYDHVGQAAGHGPAGAGRDPLAPDAPHDLAAAGYEDRRPADRSRDAGAAGATADRGARQDFVTSSYDPDRDTGYDPQAAGTAVAGRTGADRDKGYDTDYDSAQDTGYLDDPRTGASPGYDPAQDTGYVDAARAEADRTTGRRDDDYDTGRVDAGRVETEPVDPDRADTHRGADRDTHRGANTAAAAGAAAAAAFGSPHRDRPDRDDRSGGTFSAVDDTATVDATDTGRSTPGTGAVTDRGQAGVADEDDASGTRERLVPAERAAAYSSRWDALKGDFVDEPRRAVRSADELVGEVLDELQRLFADQRRDLEQSFDDDEASTEDLRLALRRYRSFFDRLLSF